MEAPRMKKQSGCVLLFLGITSLYAPRAQAQLTSELDKVYADESHCLVSPEIRSEKDSLMSRFCRDAIVEARYLYFTYVSVGSSHYDANLSGPFLALQRYAEELCSRDDAERLSSDFIDKIQDATTVKDWKWNGPEVVRTSPPDDVLRQIKPDSHGIIRYEYSVVIVQRDSKGNVIKSESFTAKNGVPALFLRDSSKPSTPRRH